MSLSDLPDDILRLISIRLNGFDNCSLWMASDSILKQRLVNNIITDFDIKYTIPGRYLWPGNFLKKLQKLSRLSLVVDPAVYHLPIQNIELFEIPTLKYLRLTVTHFQIFYRNRLASYNDPTGPTSSSPSNYINLNEYFSNLEHLDIMNRSGGDRLSIDFLRFLPKNLHFLSLPQLNLDLENPNNQLNSNMETLAQSLTELNIWSHGSDKLSFDSSKLPPNLTSLTTNLPLDEKSYDKIPKTLKQLDLFSSKYNMEKLSPFLPTGLERLSIMIDENPSTGKMLSRLSNLEGLHVQSHGKIGLDDLIIKCPPKLENFRCSELVITNVPVTGNVFNNCLTQLELNDVVGMTAELISLLPQTLTVLSIHKRYHQDSFAYFSHLPRNLKSLSTNLGIIENVSLLPQTLTFFDFSDASSNISYFDRLPPKLETLILLQKLPQSLMKQLPSSLTRLQVACDEVVDDEIVRKLPRGLKEFSLTTRDNIADAGVTDLPPSLENLALQYNTMITDDGIALLPRTLMHLHLPRNSNFTNKCVKDLPRRLIGLYLNGATKITSQSCKDLPKYLAVLFMQKCTNWDSAEMIASKHELPQYVKYANVGNQEANRTWRNLMRK